MTVRETDKLAQQAAGSVPLGIISVKFRQIARSFLEGADKLIEKGQKDPATYFLICHALELSLKAYLAARGVNIDELHRKYGHNIQKLYKESVALGFRIESKITPPHIAKHMPAFIRQISEFHTSRSFDFPFSKTMAL